jgi:glycosyltransferase involved in cell wall biosynthesis
MMGMEKEYCLWINSAEDSFYDIALELVNDAKKVVFDLSDDFSVFECNDPETFNYRLRHLISKADVLLTVNENVANKFPHKNQRIFPNSTDFDNFQKSDMNFSLPPLLPKPPHKRYVGFIGGLNKGRIDEDLLVKLFRHFTDVSFIFVGYTNDPLLRERVCSYPNVSFLDSVPYEHLPYIIKSFDVAIIPHLINAHSGGNDLLKLLDYMASGVPVVSTNCSNTHKFSDAIYIADHHDQFMCYVQAILNGEIKHNPEIGLNYARSHSWNKTVPELSKWLKEAFKD